MPSGCLIKPRVKHRLRSDPDLVFPFENQYTQICAAALYAHRRNALSLPAGARCRFCTDGARPVQSLLHGAQRTRASGCQGRRQPSLSA